MQRMRRDTVDLAELLSRLVTQAVELDVSRDVAERARSVTARALKIPDGPLSPQTQRRVEAYFTAIVRRGSVKRTAAPRAAARFVVASVIADLRATGRSGNDIWSELERGWASNVPADVLEEYRLQLCG